MLTIRRSHEVSRGRIMDIVSKIKNFTSKIMFLNLMMPEHAYLFGFIQADGTMYREKNNGVTYRNKGKLSLEINEKDKEILEKFKDMVPCHSTTGCRTRNTNFKLDFNVAFWKVCNIEFREEMIHWGMVYGKKSDIIDVPKYKYSAIDYWRGIIDGDGSLGITSQSMPFVSLYTKSDSLALSYNIFLSHELGVNKNPGKNKRDGGYNIVVFNEDAQKLTLLLYYNDCLALERKKRKAKEVLKWIRPNDRKKKTCLTTRKI